MNISKRDFQINLIYIRILRIKELGKIMFDCYFNISYFIKKPNDIRRFCMENQIKKVNKNYLWA